VVRTCTRTMVERKVDTAPFFLSTGVSNGEECTLLIKEVEETFLSSYSLLCLERTRTSPSHRMTSSQSRCSETMAERRDSFFFSCEQVESEKPQSMHNQRNRKRQLRLVFERYSSKDIAVQRKIVTRQMATMKSSTSLKSSSWISTPVPRKPTKWNAT